MTLVDLDFGVEIAPVPSGSGEDVPNLDAGL